jgi:hypothetical protein
MNRLDLVFVNFNAYVRALSLSLLYFSKGVIVFQRQVNK